MKTFPNKTIILLFAFAMNYTNMDAQLVSKHVELQELGLSFDIPDGWRGQVDGDYLLLGHITIPGLMILSSNSANSTTALKQRAEEGVMDEEVQLTPHGDFLIKNENRVEGVYTGTFNGQQVKGYAVGLINGLGKGINILMLTETTTFDEVHKKEADKLARSVVFYKAEDSQATTFWKQKLIGKQLYFGLTRGNGSEKRTIDLCSDGAFDYYGNSYIAFDENYGYGSVGNNVSNTGTYSIYSLGNTSVLELTFTNGEIVEYDLSTNDSGNTFLDNSKYYVQNSNRCN